MAPDVNTLPITILTSEHLTDQRHSSGRQSHAMGPPATPASASRSILISTSDESSMPIRHPRPLTAAELYLECEKEQEAVV